jgi:hypothetical protein
MQHKNLKRQRILGILEEVGPLAFPPANLEWRKTFNRHSKGFERIQSCVPKALTGKIL